MQTREEKESEYQTLDHCETWPVHTSEKYGFGVDQRQFRHCCSPQSEFELHAN